jgi:tetratricopeptide (TPR) repeat protein
LSEFRSRYPGTRPFSDSPADVARFFGRDAEAEELYLRVLSVPLLVQFGNSGLGKTSLLQAGLFPRLRQKPFLPVTIRLNNAEESLTAAVARAIRESCESEGLEATHRNMDGLWELLSTTTVWRDDLLLTPVLVFDQFEEVFTLRDAAFRAEIATELGAIASEIPPARVQSGRAPAVKVVISLREDYLGALEEFSAAIPSLFQERLRLSPMTEQAARDAITGPAQLVAPDLSPPFEFDPAALDMMMDELKGKSGVIEPFQLQLLARHAETIAESKGGGRLTPEDFRGAQDFESVLKNFYRDTLQRIDSRPQRTKAQILAEEGLLGASGHRLMLEERQIVSDYGVMPETLQTLETSRLVRRERRLESVFYEISHDRIADSIFRGRTSKLPRKVRQMLWVAALVAAVIVTGLCIAHYRVTRERDAAERWVSLLLGEEFFGQLRDSGRSTVSKRLQDQIVAESKAGFGTPMTRGLALRNHGDMERIDGTLPAALKAFHDALAEIESAPRDVVAMREIARTQDRIGEALVQQGQLTKALRHYDSAIAAWRDVIGQAQSVNDDCVGLAESLTSAASLNGRVGRSQAALRLSDDAFDISFGVSFDTTDRCGRRPGTVQPDPDVRAMAIMSRIALVHHDLVWNPGAVEGAAVLAARARELSPPSVKATALAMEAMAMRGLTRSSEGSTAVLQDYMEVLDELGAMQLWDADNRTWAHDRAVIRVLVARIIAGCVDTEEGCRPGVLDDAEVILVDAEATLRTQSAADSTSLTLHDHLVGALRTHGLVLAARGHEFKAESMARFDEAERLLRGRRRDPSDAAGANELSTLLVDKAEALGHLGDRQEAAATIRRAEQLLEQTVAAHPARLMFASSLYHVRTVMAELHQEAGDSTAAEEAAAKAEAVLARFKPYEADAKHVDVLQQKGAVQRRHAAELLDRDPEAALRELNASEATLRAAVRRRPAYPEGYFLLTETYVAMNAVYAKLGRAEEQLYVLPAATTAAQMARWLAPAAQQHKANEWLLTTRDLLSTALVRQKRPAEALHVLDDIVGLGQEFLAQPTPDGGALGIIGDANCRIATLQRDLGQAGWRDTLTAGLIYLRKASAVDPKQGEKLRYWTRYAAGGTVPP